MPILAALDTNIWLDLLVFRDQGVVPLADALARGHLKACMDDFGTCELTRVLGYPLGRIRLDEAAQAAILAACRRMTTPPAAAASIGLTTQAPVPLCRDRNDQPFLELARDCKADWLVTKDRDLLMLARRVSLQQSFAILSPKAAAGLLARAAATTPG